MAGSVARAAICLALIASILPTGAARSEETDSGFHPLRSAERLMMLEGAGIAGHALLSHESLGDSARDHMLRTPGLARIQASIQDDTYLASGVVAMAALAPNTPEGRQANSILRQVLSRHPNVGMGILAKVITEFAASSVSYRPPAVALAQNLNMPFEVYHRAMVTADEQARVQQEYRAWLDAKLADGDLVSEEDDPDCSTRDVNLNGSFAEIEDSVPALASERRNKTSGYASGGEKLPYIGMGSKWFSEVGPRSYAPIPRQVADVLRGRKFNNFDAFRKAVWKAIGYNPTLLAEGNFRDKDPGLLQQGRAPNRGNKQNPYHLHHIVPITNFGSVYDFDNILIINASCHRVIHTEGIKVMARKTEKKPCSRNEMEKHIEEYISLDKEMFDTCRDPIKDRYFSRKTGKRANARKAYSQAGRFTKVGAWIQENSPAEAAISDFLSDYCFALSLGEVPDAVSFLTSIAMGERPYQSPVPSDQEIIENRDIIADEMKGLVDIYKK